MNTSAHQHTHQSHSVAKRLAAFSIVLVLGCTLILIAAYVSRLWVAEKLLVNVAAEQGLTSLTLDVTRLDSSNVTIENIAAPSKSLLVRRLEIDFTWREIFERRVEKVVVQGVQINIDAGNQDFNFSTLTDLSSEEENSNSNQFFEARQVSVSDAVVTLEWNQRTFTFGMELEALENPNGWDTGFSGLLEGDYGTLQANWKGTINLDDLAGSSGRGAIGVNVGTLGTVENVSASGTIVALLDDRTLKVEILRPIAFRSKSVPVGISMHLPEELAVAVENGIEGTISGNQAAAVTVRQTGESFFAEADLSAELKTGRTKVATHFKGELSAQGNGNIDHFFVENLETEVVDLPLYGGRFSGTLHLAEIASPISENTVPTKLTFDFRTPRLDGMQIDRIAGEITSNLSVENSRLHFESRDSQVNFENFRIPSTVHIPGTTTFNHTSRGSEFSSNFTVPLGGDQSSPIEFDVAGTLSTLSVHVEAMESQERINVELPKLRLFGSVRPNVCEKIVTVKLDDGSVDHALGKISDISVNLFVRNDRISGTTDLRIDRVGDVQFESPAQQLGLRAITTFRQNSGTTLASGGLKAHNTAVFAQYTAQIENDGSSGNLYLEIPRARLGSRGSINASMVSAFVPVTDLGGIASLDINVDWDESGLRHSGTLDINNGRLETPYGDVNGLTTNLALESLWPPRANMPQIVEIKELNFGIPLTNLNAEITWPGDNTSLIENISVSTYSGRLYAADILIPFEKPAGDFIVTAEDINISTLTALADIDGLKIDGFLSGKIPVHVSPEDLKIAGAHLTTAMPGVVQYRPTPAPAGLANTGGGALLLRALDNFKYDSISVLIDGSVQDEMDVNLLFQGRNPDLYDGYPISFNLNLNGKLFEIAKSGLSGYRLPQTLRNGTR